MREMVQQQPGAGVPTSFGVFPSSSFLKVSAEPGGTAAPRGAAWGSRGGRTPPAPPPPLRPAGAAREAARPDALRPRVHPVRAGTRPGAARAAHPGAAAPTAAALRGVGPPRSTARPPRPGNPPSPSRPIKPRAATTCSSFRPYRGGGAGGGRGCRGDTHPEPPPPAASTESGVMARVSPNRRRRGKSANGKRQTASAPFRAPLSTRTPRGAHTSGAPRPSASPHHHRGRFKGGGGAPPGRPARRRLSSPLLCSPPRRAPSPFRSPRFKVSARIRARPPLPVRQDGARRGRG